MPISLSEAQTIWDNQTPYDDECDEYCECDECLLINFNDEEE